MGIQNIPPVSMAVIFFLNYKADVIKIKYYKLLYHLMDQVHGVWRFISSM